MSSIRVSLRRLRHRRGFALVVILTLALGIGSITAMFSIVDAVLLKPLPYPEPSRLVLLQGHKKGIGNEAASVPDFLDWRAQSRSFSAMTAFAGASLNLTDDDGRAPERIIAARVTTGFFSTLGVPLALGGDFTAEDGRPGGAKVVILSQALWRDRFGASPNVLGRSITLGGEPHTVIGIAASGFRFPSWAQVWTPLVLQPGAPGQSRRSDFLSVVGRLVPGVTVARARAEMMTIARRLESQYRKTNSGWGVAVTPLRERIVGNVQPALLIFFAAVGLVLLIACANVANLMLSKGASRRREMALRAALGAGRGRLIRQLLGESLVLSTLGGALGVIGAWWGTAALVRLDPGALPRSGEIRVDAPVLLFALAASLATTLLFALVPTIRTSRTDLRRDLAEGEHGVLARRSGLLDKGLVVFQVGIALVLLVGAGLLIRSFTNLLAVNPGFDARGVLTARVTLPKNQYSEDAQVTQFWHGMVERAEGLPGVESAGLTTDLPLESGSYLTFRVEGRPAPPPDTVQDTVVASAGGDYFRALRIPVLHGRALDPQDDRDGRPVAVVDQAMAQRYWPGLSPIGDRISFGGPWYTVVGIVGSVRTDSLERPSYPHAYLSYLQSPSRSMVLTLRAKSNPGVLVGSLRAALARLDPALPLYSIRTMDDVVERSTMRPRFNLVVLGGFAGAALLLALVGIYGVLSHAVSRRARELGIRRALGADQGVTIRFVLLLGLAPVAAGLVLGLFAALAAERALSSLLFGVSPFDPMTIIVAVIAIALASTVACALPALRAARIDPMEALREE